MSAPSHTTRRGRPPRISADQIVDVALELAVEGLTVAAVARELGVAAPAIYRYFDSLEALQTALLAQVLGDADLDHEAGWRDYLTAFAAQLEAVLQRYPALVGVNAAQNWEALGPLVAPLLNGALQRMLPAGFTPAEALSLFNAVTTLVHGAATAAAAIDSVESLPDFEGIDAGARTEEVLAVLRADPRPGIVESVGLRWLLDGAEAALEARA